MDMNHTLEIVHTMGPLATLTLHASFPDAAGRAQYRLIDAALAIRGTITWDEEAERYVCELWRDLRLDGFTLTWLSAQLLLLTQIERKKTCMSAEDWQWIAEDEDVMDGEA